MRHFISLVGFFVAVLLPFGASGQSQPRPGEPSQFAPLLGDLPLIGSTLEDRHRTAQVLGSREADGFLIRSPSSEASRIGLGRPFAWSLIAPSARFVWNSDLPFSINEDLLWAGRGTNVSLLAGVRTEAGPLSLIIAPQVTYSENQAFQIFSLDREGRSQFASPWHSGPQWGDIPLRFGDQPFFRIDPGQSSVTLRAGQLEVGAATENQWWGPGSRTALLLSNNAPGFPHVFLRTAETLRTPVGNFEGRWLLGALSESLYFDSDDSNDLRSLSGFGFTYRSGLAPNLTMGAARVVYSSVEGIGALAARGADVFVRWDERVLDPQDPSEIPEQGWTQPGGVTSEQMFSAFGRAILPDDGLEFYVEWARSELPTSVRDLLAQPNHSQAFTLGGQWVAPVWGSSMFRIEAEASYLEEPATFDTRPVGSYYLSRSIPQGYTHRGRVLGAATGPGSSSQWLGTDFLASGWRVGLVGGRIRWENDEYYRDLSRVEVGHDVSVFGGVRAGVEILGLEWSAEALHALRMNYLFQNPAFEPYGHNAIDVRNTTLRIAAQPVVRRRTPAP